MPTRAIDAIPDSPGIPISEWVYVNTALVWVTEREVEAQYLNTPYRMEEQIIAWLVRNGEICVKAGGETAIARAGEWIFPGTKSGRQLMQPGTAILSMRFVAGWPTGRTLFDHGEMVVLKASLERRLTKAAEKLEALARRASGRKGFYEIHQSRATMLSYFAIRRAFEDWLSAYVHMMLRTGHQPTLMRSADRRVLQAARLMDGHSLRQPFPESELALKAGLSVSQLNRLFLRDLGTSPKNYLERRRLQEAALLLRHYKRSVKETAYELGFSSLPHFSAWFRRKEGVSPRAYQKQTG